MSAGRKGVVWYPNPASLDRSVMEGAWAVGEARGAATSPTCIATFPTHHGGELECILLEIFNGPHQYHLFHSGRYSRDQLFRLQLELYVK